VLVEASILVDAPRDDVYAILTEYGGPARLRINPALKAQTVLEHQENVYLCENVWEQEGKQLVQRRRYTLIPPDRIEEEVVGATEGMLRVTTTVAEERDQTRLTMVSEYRLTGLWRLVGGTLAKKLEDQDQQLLEVLKAGLEAEFEEVEEE
jgi:triphosphoribosyl-dephospho-CoA synthetase